MTNTSELMTMLIVDDNEMNIEMMYDYFSMHGYNVIIAHNGWECLEQVDRQSPNIILMDIQMPGMDGLEATRRLRMHANPQVVSTPIVAITALAMPGDRELCISAGANAYISKPFRMHDLLQLVQTLVESHERTV